MKKTIIFLGLVIISMTTVFSQNSSKKFAIGVNATIADFVGPGDGSFYKNGNTNLYLGPNFYSFTNISFNVVKPLNIVSSLSLYKNDDYNSYQKDNYLWKWDLGVQFRFLSPFISDDAVFDPYIYVNGGVFEELENVSPVINGGLGLNIWVHENFAFTGQSGFNYAFSNSNFYETSFGVKIKFGDPDSDKDGLSDSKDLCPYEKGDIALNGCPDADGDGIIDSEDKCPNDKGDKTMGGCPDTDGDGIIDIEDKCPNVKGLAKFDGCPDTDGDGIIDSKDKCPNVKGLANFDGCPDTDGDGIIDSKDKCPNKKGTPKTNGCPDADNDGIIDSEDLCPNEPGIIENKGCPKIEEEKKEEIKQELSFSAENIEFETGSATIKTSSYSDLDKIVDVMKKYPYLKFSIDGYTDNTGNKDVNLELSQKRADAVKKYFTDKNIASHRLNSKGYGIANPIASNRTRAGRAKNRRVEVNIQD